MVVLWGCGSALSTQRPQAGPSLEGVPKGAAVPRTAFGGAGAGGSGAPEGKIEFPCFFFCFFLNFEGFGGLPLGGRGVQAPGYEIFPLKFPTNHTGKMLELCWGVAKI